jgi:hypothetical protein
MISPFTALHPAATIQPATVIMPNMLGLTTAVMEYAVLSPTAVLCFTSALRPTASPPRLAALPHPTPTQPHNPSLLSIADFI